MSFFLYIYRKTQYEMTLDSYISSNKNQDTVGFNKALAVLKKLADVIDGFESKITKKLNVSKFAKMVKVSEEQIGEILDVLVKCQAVFEKSVKNFKIKKSKANGSLYLNFEIPPQSKKVDQAQIYEGTVSHVVKNDSNSDKRAQEIEISLSQARQINDIVYMFKKINRGKGFDLNVNGNELLKNISALKSSYPFLFRVNGGNLVYPTDICLELGELILSYTKASKPLSQFELNNYVIKVEQQS